ncbi:unnamed protein product [Cuscuta campestris]|uniref:DUF4219 domain-containing protein n=1 Tax=Cuscuta campestris TaxID=132261 RepID=A0A484LNA0_9ASTE|nr:unnamed protein product [Cuscuta campestris]
MPNSDGKFYPSLLKPWSNINTRQNDLTQRWGLYPIDGNPAMGRLNDRWEGMTVGSHLRLILFLFGSQPPTQRWEACTHRWVGIGEGQSTSRPPLFDGTNYTYWKERMRIYIRSTNFQLWLVIKNGEETPMKVGEKLVPKTEDEFHAEDIKKVENYAKAINMLYCAVKEMWDKLEVTYEGIGEGQSTSRPPLFDGTNYTYWKERMRIYIRSTNFQLWLVIKNGEETPMKVGEKLVPKTEDEFDAEEIKKVENYAKAINTLYCTVNPDDYRKISCCTTAKEMWDKLEVTYEGTDQVREAKIDFLTQEYEMFRTKEGEKIDDMFDRFSKIINDLHALKKTYANKDLVRKILQSLTPEWRSKADAIYESIEVSNVTIDGLRDQSQRHSRRKALPRPQPFPYLDGSFLEFGSEEELTRFLNHFAKRPISPPRVLPELYPQDKGYHDLDNQLKESGLWPFVSTSRTSYNPAYVRAFYSNLRRDGDTIYSSINLYDIEIDLPTFARIAGLPIRGDDITTYGGDDWILNNEAVVIRELGITNLIRHSGPTGQAPPSLPHHPDSSPPGQQPHLALQRGLEGDSRHHARRLHQLGEIRHDSHGGLCLHRHRAELAIRLPRHGPHRLRRHPHRRAKHEDDEVVGHRRHHLQEEVRRPRRRQTKSCLCPCPAPARASLQSIADTLNRLTLTVDDMGQYMERMDWTLQRQHHHMTAFFRSINYVPPPFDNTILGQNFEGEDEDDDSYAPSSSPDEADFEDAVDGDPMDVENDEDDDEDEDADA